MGILKIIVVLAVVSGLSVNLWARRARFGKQGGVIAAAVNARSAAFGDAVLIQAAVMTVGLLAGVGDIALGLMLAGMAASVAAFWLRVRVERATVAA